jgi:hypothetical protein
VEVVLQLGCSATATPARDEQSLMRRSDNKSYVVAKPRIRSGKCDSQVVRRHGGFWKALVVNATGCKKLVVMVVVKAVATKKKDCSGEGRN